MSFTIFYGVKTKESIKNQRTWNSVNNIAFWGNGIITVANKLMIIVLSMIEASLHCTYAAFTSIVIHRIVKSVNKANKNSYSLNYSQRQFFVARATWEINTENLASYYRMKDVN